MILWTAYCFRGIRVCLHFGGNKDWIPLFHRYIDRDKDEFTLGIVFLFWNRTFEGVKYSEAMNISVTNSKLLFRLIFPNRFMFCKRCIVNEVFELFWQNRLCSDMLSVWIKYIAFTWYSSCIWNCIETSICFLKWFVFFSDMYCQTLTRSTVNNP